MSDCGCHVRSHRKGDQRGRCRADQSRGKKHLGDRSGKITQQDLPPLVAKMTPEAEQSAQAYRGNELHRLKIKNDFRIFLRSDRRQQLQAQVLCYAFRVNLGSSNGKHQNPILDLALQVLERRLSHDCESSGDDSPWAVYWQREVKAIPAQHR